jgi:hypothetical protein
MRLKTLFVLNTIVSVPFGMGSVVAPHLFLSLFGATLGPAGAVMMQYGGAWLIALGLLTWLTRDATESEAGHSMTGQYIAGRYIALALLIGYLIALVVSVLGQLSGALNALGWMPVLIQVVFAAGLGYSLVAGRGVASPSASRS